MPYRKAMNVATPIKPQMSVGHTVCPHDCPSACALEVDISQEGRIGRVRGAGANTYTAGVICAKVARYSERIYHPGRLMVPQRRKGEKGRWRLAAAVVGRCAGRDRRRLRQGRAATWLRSRLALFLCRDDGAGAARFDRPPASCQALFRLFRLDLHQPGLDRACHGDRFAARPPIRSRWRNPIAW